MKSVSRRDVLRWMASAIPASVVVSKAGDYVLHAAALTGHPRLMFTPNDIPAIRAKLTAYYGSSSPYPDIKGAFQTAINDCDQAFGGIGDMFNALSYAPMYAFLANILPCQGFSSTHTPAQHGAEAARLVTLAAAAAPQLQEPGWPFPYFGYIYDWAFNYLTPAQRATIVAAMKTMTVNEALPIYNSPWAADSSKALLCELVYASAAANDGIDDQWANDVFARFPTRVVSKTGVLGEESAVAQVGPTVMGCGPQSGLAYMNYQWMYWVTGSEAHRTATGQTKAAYYTSDYDAVASEMAWLIYSLRPYAVSDSNYPGGFRWGLIRSQYTLTDQCDVFSPAEIFPAVFAGIYKDIYPTEARLAQWYARKRLGTTLFSPTGYRVGRWTFRFVCEDPTLPEQAPTSLPLSAAFGDGRYEFKSGWDSDTATNTNWAVRFHAPRYETLNDGREPMTLAGHYEIHRKGPQTIIRGTLAHNPLVPGALNRLYFLDTTFVPPFANTGPNGFATRMAGRSWLGQNPYANDRGLDLVPGNPADYYTETRSRFAAGAVDMDYLFADLTKWWPSAAKFTDSNNPAMVTLYHDQKVLFRPASAAGPVLVVIYVRYATTGTQYQPIYCWNPAGPAITVDGVETANTPVRWSGGHGNWTYTGATRAICTNTASVGSPAYNGKNVLTVIRPVSRTIIKSGGPDEQGNRFQDTTGAFPGAFEHISKTYSCEDVDYYGQRYDMGPNAGDTDLVTHHGEYFIQIQPSPIVTSGDFLLVNEVGDSTMTPSACEHIVGTNFAGVAIHAPDGKRIAVFGTAGDSATGTFVIPSAGTYKCLICNLRALTCAISGGSNIGSITAVEGSGGSPFAVPSSRTVYVTIVVGANGTGAANTITLQGSGVPAPPPPSPPTGVRIIK